MGTPVDPLAIHLDELTADLRSSCEVRYVKFIRATLSPEPQALPGIDAVVTHFCEERNGWLHIVWELEGHSQLTFALGPDHWQLAGGRGKPFTKEDEPSSFSLPAGQFTPYQPVPDLLLDLSSGMGYYLRGCGFFPTTMDLLFTDIRRMFPDGRMLYRLQALDPAERCCRIDVTIGKDLYEWKPEVSN